LWTRDQSCMQKLAGFLVSLLFSPEEGRGMFLQNTSWPSVDYTTLKCRRWDSFVMWVVHMFKLTYHSYITLHTFELYLPLGRYFLETECVLVLITGVMRVEGTFVYVLNCTVKLPSLWQLSLWNILLTVCCLLQNCRRDGLLFLILEANTFTLFPFFTEFAIGKGINICH
jgi:hypothetical protein